MAGIREADAAAMFDELVAQAENQAEPESIGAAVLLVEEAALQPLQAEAVQHYVAEGVPVAQLSKSVLESAVSAYVAARCAIRLAREPAADEIDTQRRVFVDLMTSLAPSLGVEAPFALTLARRLIWTLTRRLECGRAFLKQAEADPVSAWFASRDLLEAAGVGLILSGLIEAPVLPNESVA